MIVVYAHTVGVKKHQTLKFMDGQMPRIGETLKLGTTYYRITMVVHCFRRWDIAHALENEKYFMDVPCAEITLEKM